MYIYMNICIYIIFIHNINIHNTHIHNINTYIFLFIFIEICLLFTRLCCFTAPLAMPNNDNTLI